MADREWRREDNESQNETDRDLVARLSAGDPTALDRTLELYGDRVWRFLMHLSGAPSPDDLFQETWLALARHAQRLEPSTPLLPWLLTVARNRYLTERRRGRWQVVEFDETLDTASDAADPNPELQFELQAVAHAIYALSELHREALLLSAVEGLSSYDIARVLGIAESAVRKRLSRARAQLQQQLKRTQNRG